MSNINNNDIVRYELRNNALIYTSKNGDKYVAKKDNDSLLNIYNYLKTRSFVYIPDIMFYDKYYVYKYIDNCFIPDNKRIYDIIKITALLHSKTVYFKDVSIDYIKSIYEKYLAKIDNTFKYYDNYINNIESKEFISPSEYMLLRNCTVVYSCLSFSKQSVESWYKKAKENGKIRMTVVHNNLDVNHIVENDKAYLISWDKSTIDMPIYDIIKLYKKSYDKYDFISLFYEYNKIFSLTDDEKELLYAILFIPDIINSNSELCKSIETSNLFNYLKKTNDLFMKYQTKKSKEENKNINKENESMESNT